MKDDYSLEVAQETGLWFNYAGKNSWEMSRLELVKIVIESEKRHRRNLESQRKSYYLFREACPERRNRGFLARLFGF